MLGNFMDGSVDWAVNIAMIPIMATLMVGMS